MSRQVKKEHKRTVHIIALVDSKSKKGMKKGHIYKVGEELSKELIAQKKARLATSEDEKLKK